MSNVDLVLQQFDAMLLVGLCIKGGLPHPMGYLALAVPGRLTLIYEHCPYLFVVCIQCDYLIRVFLSLLFPTIIYLNFALTITGEILLWVVVGARLELVL